MALAAVSKKRKIDGEGRVFKNSWTEDYFVIEHNQGITCVICQKRISVCKEYNVKRHYITKHAEQFDVLVGQVRNDRVNALKQDLVGQQSFFKAVNQTSESATKDIAPHEKMVLKADQVRVKALLAETITLLCKNGLHFKAKFSIQALIGITLDEEDVFLVNINETIASKDSAPSNDEDSGPFEHQQPHTGKRSRGGAARAASGHSPGPASPSVKSLGGNSSIPKFPSNSRSTRITRQTSPHSVAVAHSSDVAAGSRPPDTSGVFGGVGDPSAELTTDSLPSASVGISDSGGGIVTFPAVSIKNDSRSNDDSYDDSKPLPEESDLPEEPTTKRMRLRVSDVRPEPSSVTTPSSSEANANFASSKSEPPDVIEIKEEEYSDSESQLPNYSAYGDYNTAMYGGANQDMAHGFGDASMFQASSSFFVQQSGDDEQTPERQGHRLYRLGALNTGRHRGSYVCPKCGQAFTWKTALRQHENNIHRRRPHPFLCPFCSKGFWNRRDLQGHMAAKHEVQKEFPCPNCGREYSYKGHLTVHLKVCRATSL